MEKKLDVTNAKELEGALAGLTGKYSELVEKIAELESRLDQCEHSHADEDPLATQAEVDRHTRRLDELEGFGSKLNLNVARSQQISQVLWWASSQGIIAGLPAEP